MKKFYLSLVFTAIGLLSFTGTMKAADYYLKSGTGHIAQLGSWGSNPDGSGASPTSFAGTNTWHFTNRTGVNYNFSPNFSIPAVATMSIHSGFSFTIAGSGNFSNTFAIDIASGGSLTISKSTNLHFNNVDVNSTIIFNTANYPVRPFTNYQNPLTYGNVVIASSNSISGTGVDIFVGGILTINSGVAFDISSNNLYLMGTSASISGAGTITSDASSIISLSNGGGANNGTLNFTSSSALLNQLIISYNSGSDLIGLGSDLEIQNGYFADFTGSVDLNGHSLSIDAGSDISFPGSNTLGSFFGDPASSILINGTIGGGTGSPMLVMDGTDNSLASIVVNSNGNTLQMGSALVIIDSLSVLDGIFDAAGLVTINGDASIKGRISRIGSSGSISGNVTVETFISGGTGGTGWMNMGAPGVTGQTVADWDNYPANGVPMSCTGCTYPPLQGTFTSIQSYVESTMAYVPLTAASALNPGEGHWVYVGSGQVNTTDLTLVNTGAPVQGSMAVNLTSAGSGTNKGYNLIANPYASPISWTAVYNLNSGNSALSGAISAWKPDNGGVFGSYTQGGGSGTNGMGDVIPAGQGFYVSVSSATSIVFDESVKTSINTTNMLRTTSNSPEDAFKLAIVGTWSGDETMFRFKSNATAGFDRQFDAEKMFSTAGYYGTGPSYSKYTTISSKDERGKDYAINTLPSLTKSMNIPILARVNYAGTYSIVARDADNFGSCLLLKDKLTNTYHDLRKSPYVFTISDTTSKPRFELMLCQTESGPVSVEELNRASGIQIAQDAEGVFVRTSFPVNTKATISVYNIIGQELVKDVTVTGTENLTRLNIGLHNQVVLIRVNTDSETQVKKVIVH